MQVVKNEKSVIRTLNIIATSDRGLLDINKKFLNHDYYTDVITFQNNPEEVSGEIYLSISRIKDNSSKMKVKLKDELHRVIVHGILHMIGYGDKTEKDARLMRQKEDYYLNLRAF